MNNRKDFHRMPDWQTPEVTSINRAPAHTPWRAFPDERTASAYADSPYRLSLNGSYDFKLYENPAAVDDFYLPEYNASAFTPIAVPGNWELQGHSKPIYTNYVYPWHYDTAETCAIKPNADSAPCVNPPHLPADNPTGCYRRTFDVPASFSGRDVFLCFEGVETSFYLWINGEPVGYSEDSKLPCTFKITDYVKPGANLLALQVMRFATSIYLEDQDYWHLSGVNRNVWLVSKPVMRIDDYKITAIPNLHTGAGVVSADITVAREPFFADYTVRLAVYDGPANLASEIGYISATAQYRTTGVPTANAGRVTLTLPNAALWSPEKPNLYTAVVTLIAPDGTEIDCESCRIGFKLVEMVDNVLHVNGKRLIVRGTNRHEHSWEGGRVVSRAHMVEEIRQMKRMNINSVRTCHYPDAPEWYDLCDELGILLVCECNLETHGVMGALSHNPSYALEYVERAMRMMLTHKNHPSIYSWSLGNESGTGANHAAMAGFIKEYDKTRLCQYEAGEPGKNISDIRGNMYATPEAIENMLADPTDRRPVILVEYLYQIRNSGGGMARFIELLERYPLFQGGYVWDWQDKALVGKTPGGEKFFAYGGDFGEPVVEWECPVFMTNNGLVLADLTWKPVAHEVKQAYAPVWFERPRHFSAWTTIARDGHYVLKNRCADESLTAFRCVAVLRENGIVIKEQEIELPDLAPMTEQAIEINVPHEKHGGAVYHLTLSIRRRSAAWYAAADEEIGFRQFALASGAAVTPAAKPAHRVTMREDEAAFTLTGNGLTAVIGKASAVLESLTKNGFNYLSGGAPCFERPYTGLDAIPGWGWRGLFEQFSGLRQTVGKPVCLVSDHAVRIELPVTLRSETGWPIEGTLAYTFDGNAVKVSYQVQIDEAYLAVPRAGLAFTAPQGFEALSYFGYGGAENYKDRLFAAELGVHHSTVSAQHFPFSPPSECGGHEHTQWLTLANDTGQTLTIASRKPFHFDAHHNTIEDYKAAAHSHELPLRAETTLHIDAAHAAIGSEMAWSTSMPDHQRVAGGGYALEIEIYAK